MSDVLFTIQHPADVHLFRNAIAELESDGHEVHVFAREKDVNIELLNRYDIEHEVLVGSSPGVLGTAKMQLAYEYKLFRKAFQIQPDVMCSDGGIAISHISTVLDAPSLVFTDTEHVVDSLIDRRHLIYRFSDEVHTPSCYWLDLGDNHHSYPSYHELAYLHPERFTPDPGIREDLGLADDDRVALLRLVSWDAFHDRDNKGISDMGELIAHLQERGLKVFISAEGGIPEGYSHLEVDLPVEQIHHLVAESALFIGDSSTMAAECAVLGTPAVFISSLELGYISELEHEYDIVTSLSPTEEPYLETEIERILAREQDHWECCRQSILKEKVDTTEYIVDQIRRHT